MDLPKEFLKNIEQSDDIYEIIALCYNILLEHKGDADVCFIAQAGRLSNDIDFGGYAERFEDLRQRLVSSAVKIDMDDDAAGTGFECFQSDLIENLSYFQCPEKMDEPTCMSFCMFYTIEALDTYITKNLDSVYFNLQSFGPLNHGSSKRHSVVYLQEKTSFLSEAYKGENSFRKPLKETRIGSLFNSVLLIECKAFCASIPEIAPVFLPGSFRSTFEQSKNLRIASIPFIGFDTFRFHEKNNKEPCEAGRMPNGQFYIEYVDKEEESSQVIALLELAIQSKANIIVFPEFIMSNSMLNAMKSYLRGLAFERKDQLFLVLAGTNYEQKDRENGNNVLHILNPSGYEIGCYYKYSPFLQQSEECFHGASLTPQNGQEHDVQHNNPGKRIYLKNCEILSDPGKECTIVDVELVGRILPAICRDVIDGKYTKTLANLFLPSMLLVPAWSSSVASFDSRFSELADTLHITSLLCNCCNAVKGQGERKIGKLVYPSKQETSMKAIPLEISRSSYCMNNCKESGGCIALIDVDFSEGRPTATRQVVFPCATT